MIVEVSHPSIVAEYGLRFLHTADFMVNKAAECPHHCTHYMFLLPLQIGSPTALADRDVSTALFEEARRSHGLYVAVGALWGAQDIQKMADGGTLKVGFFLLPVISYNVIRCVGVEGHYEEAPVCIQTVWLPCRKTPESWQ